MQQTNRTILFEEVNPDVGDLLQLIGEQNGRQSLTDDELWEINRRLEVNSFDEFIKKFAPGVNMLLDTNYRTVQFSRGHLGSGEEHISLNKEASLFSMLVYIMEAKKRKKYILTGFMDLLDNMIPKEDTNTFIDVRNQIIQEVQQQGGVFTEAIRKKVQKLILQYDDGIFLLTSYINDTCHILTLSDRDRGRDKGILNDYGKMQIRVIRKAARYRYVQADQIALDIDDFEESIMQCMEEAQHHRPVKNKQLFLDCFMLNVYYNNKEFEMIQRGYEDYCNLYTDIIRKFWIEAKPIMETMLGIKEFFDQYQDTDGMKPSLVIANFRIEELLHEKNREKLDVYLNTVNSKNFYHQTLWYAIIPNMISAGRESMTNIRERFRSNRERFQYDRNKPEEIALLLDILGKYKIQSFLSLALVEENTFSQFQKNGIDGINESLAVLEHVNARDYIIPCYPNFIVIPQEQACLTIGRQVAYNDLTETMEVTGDKILWLDEIGIGASYIAAGIVAACQCPQYLKKYYRKGIDDTQPGVGYRLTAQNHNQIIYSAMLSETIEYSQEILEEALQKSRGFLFGQHQGKMTVLTDRVFSYHRNYRLSCSMVQTSTYMERMIQYETQDFKKNLIAQFFQHRPGSTIAMWSAGDKNTLNAILKDGESITYKLDEKQENCTFFIEFNDEDNNVVRQDKVTIL
ncbi:MAG: hypothetical protein ACLS6E_13785 [Lachnospiraceae bacterium]